MKIAILCTAFLCLLQLGLALGISGMRRKYRQSIGQPDDPNHPLCRTRTAFSNCAEWHPALIVLMLTLQMAGAPPWTVWLAPLVVMSRYLMVAGLVTYPNTRPNGLRLAGAVGTYLLTFVLCVLILIAYWPDPGPFVATPSK
jgi:uncharacterized membrane protein YecN with MAPEG domain